MSELRFSEKTNQALFVAQRLTGRLNHVIVGTEHVLYGLARIEETIAQNALKHFNLTSENIR